MYFRKKKSKGYEYLQIVEGVRENGKVRQRVITTLGRLDKLEESGQLASLLASGAKCSQEVAILSEHKRGNIEAARKVKIGPVRIFQRLWRETAIADSLGAALAGRRFEFDVVGSIFLTVLHRIMDPGSDRAAENWAKDYDFQPSIAELQLHQFYRAMAWLGEELPEEEQAGRTPFTPRCVKDLIEEHMFVQRRDLFSEVAVVLFDTTSLYFEGEGGETLGERGHSKDHRPDLKQMVVGLVIDQEGRPLCCEMWPGNTTDVTTILPVIERLKRHFGISQVCIVADRGMISQDNAAAIEANKDWNYILGARMRNSLEVKEEVLGCGGRYKEITPKRGKAKDPSPLKVKNVQLESGRYVVCLNEEQARKDKADREAIIASLEKNLKQGDKKLVGNKGYRKYIKPTRKNSFHIDQQKIDNESRYDGKWVLKTNLDWSAEDIAMTYKQLLMVESLFRTIKSILQTRPIYHKTDETIRGHVFCSFLALVLMRELQDRLWGDGYIDAEWKDVLRDLDFLDETEVETAEGKRFVIRGPVKGWCSQVFRAAGVAIPKTMRQLNRKETA